MASQMERKGKTKKVRAFCVLLIYSQLYNDPVLCFNNVKDILFKKKKIKHGNNMENRLGLSFCSALVVSARKLNNDIPWVGVFSLDLFIWLQI